MTFQPAINFLKQVFRNVTDKKIMIQNFEILRMEVDFFYKHG